jgi:hypothetical protein
MMVGGRFFGPASFLLVRVVQVLDYRRAPVDGHPRSVTGLLGFAIVHPSSPCGRRAPSNRVR